MDDQRSEVKMDDRMSSPKNVPYQKYSVPVPTLLMGTGRNGQTSKIKHQCEIKDFFKQFVISKKNINGVKKR